MPSLLTNLPHRCTIQRRVRTVDSIGGSIDSRTIEQTNVKCWEQAATAREVSDFQKKGMSIDRRIYFAENPNVTSRHEIIITARSGETIAAADRIVLDVNSVQAQYGPGGLKYFEVIANEHTGASQ